MLRLKYEKKRRYMGLVFILPWILGTLIFFIQPLIETIRYSFSDANINPDTGELMLQSLENGIFQNFADAFTKDSWFVITFQSAIVSMLYSVPVIVIYSLFIANILVKKFAGRTVMRALFFLPVIIASGIVIRFMQNSLASVQMGGSYDTGNLFSSARLTELLLNSGLSEGIVGYISNAVSNLASLVWQSGIQILVFMAGIFAIPHTYQEVASVEGATGWEYFWKITFPLISPYIIICFVYSIVDILSTYNSDVMMHIMSTIYIQFKFSLGSALSWIYFLAVMLFIGIATGIVTLFTRKKFK